MERHRTQSHDLGLSIHICDFCSLAVETGLRIWQEGRISHRYKVAEHDGGSYGILSILRWSMVVIFLCFGIQKFTPQSAHGIFQYISNSPFIWWLQILGVRGEAYFLGVVELSTALVFALGAWIPFASALAAFVGAITFLITWSFFFTTPGVVKWSISTDPIAWNLTGEFLFKDLVLFAVCLVLLLASIRQTTSLKQEAQRRIG